MRQYILISYDPETVNLGNNAKGVLYDYLVNELDDRKIVCRIMEYNRDPRRMNSNNQIQRRRG